MTETWFDADKAIDELEAAGWEKWDGSTTVWKAPNGALFFGPHKAWAIMKGLKASNRSLVGTPKECSAREFAKTWVLAPNRTLEDADYDFAEAYAAWLKDGATVGESTGCEKHQNFKSHGDWCPPCLMDELQEAKKILRGVPEPFCPANKKDCPCPEALPTIGNGEELPVCPHSIFAPHEHCIGCWKKGFNMMYARVKQLEAQLGIDGAEPATTGAGDSEHTE